ncbi:MAG: peptidoglycan DD-metalloendopeptidase family protein [Anaerolineaceae bacterium]|nr:peptidoglycan DD-metalloendopeptidase family protein [Anaerolineaceae bacterium]
MNTIVELRPTSTQTMDLDSVLNDEPSQITPHPISTSLDEKSTQIQPVVTPSATREIKTVNVNLYTPLFDFPISEDASQEIEASYRFGSTMFGERIPHDGVEILNPEGTPVLAVEDGKVYFSGNDRTFKRGRFTNFYGNIIILEHELPGYSVPVYSFYAHLSEINVHNGETITRGQKIGSVGATGKAFTNHLHFEVRIGDVLLQNARNPELFLPLLPTEDQPDVGILIGSLTSQNGNPIRGVSVVVQKIEDGILVPGTSIYAETYAKTISSEQNWGENFVISNLPEGEYRVSAFAYQYFVERIITIKGNEFTTVFLHPED